MKKVVKIFILLLTTSFSAAIGNTNTQQNYINNVTNFSITTLVSTQVITYVVTSVSQSYYYLRDKISEISASFWQTFCDFVWRYKWPLVAGSVAGGYATLNAYLLSIKRNLRDPVRWFNWKKDCSLTDLYVLDQEKLSRELITEIQRRYLVPTQPTDFITPMIRFMLEISHECTILERYITLGHYLGKIKLARYTLYDWDLSRQCEEWLRRSSFIKAVFTHWMANFKIEQQVAVAVPL